MLSRHSVYYVWRSRPACGTSVSALRAVTIPKLLPSPISQKLFFWHGCGDGFWPTMHFDISPSLATGTQQFALLDIVFAMLVGCQAWSCVLKSSVSLDFAFRILNKSSQGQRLGDHQNHKDTHGITI